MAPSPTDSDGSGTISSGSISICEPRPVQRGQAPWGELNENTRGSSSARLGPCTGQANFSEKVMTVPPRVARVPIRSGDVTSPVIGRARAPRRLDLPVGQRHRGLHGVGQALAQVRAHHEPVHDDRDVVLVLLVELDRVVELAHLAVDLHPREALAAQLLEQLPVLALAAAHDRREHHEPRALLEGHHVVDDLLRRLALDLTAADVAVRLADPRPEQAQVVVDLGHRPDRGPRVARGGLLVDRDRRRQALDRVDVGLVHLAEELAGVRGQRLDVAALALGVDRVERQRRLPGARQPRDHHERVPRDGHGDVSQIVLAGARDDDLVGGGHNSVRL